MEDTFKIFLGSLPPKCTNKKVKQKLSKFGSVIHVHLIFDKKNNFCKGYGHVIIADRATFDKILKSQLTIGGRNIFKEPFFEGKKLQEKKLDFLSKRIFISNIPFEMEDFQVENLFSRFGEVENAYRIISSNGKRKPFGFVLFRDEQSAWLCDQESRIKFNNQVIYCRFFKKNDNQNFEKSNKQQSQRKKIRPKNKKNSKYSFEKNKKKKFVQNPGKKVRQLDNRLSNYDQRKKYHQNPNFQKEEEGPFYHHQLDEYEAENPYQQQPQKGTHLYYNSKRNTDSEQLLASEANSNQQFTFQDLVHERHQEISSRGHLKQNYAFNNKKRNNKNSHPFYRINSKNFDTSFSSNFPTNLYGKKNQNLSRNPLFTEQPLNTFNYNINYSSLECDFEGKASQKNRMVKSPRHHQVELQQYQAAENTKKNQGKKIKIFNQKKFQRNFVENGKKPWLKYSVLQNIFINHLIPGNLHIQF